MPHEKLFTAMVMSIIAGSSTTAASSISVQNVDQAGMNMSLVHADSIFAGLTMFHAPAPIAWGALVLILSITSIVFMRTNF